MHLGWQCPGKSGKRESGRAVRGRVPARQNACASSNQASSISWVGQQLVVRGMEWTGVVLAGLKHAPTVVAICVVESERSARDHPTASGTGGALSPPPRAWGERVLHVAGSRLCQSQLVSSPARDRSSLSHSLAQRACSLGCSRTGTQDVATHPRQAPTGTS